jgi:fatty acid desaturase
MAAEADDEQARRAARREQYQAESRDRSRRMVAKFQIAFAAIWVALAAARWFDGGSDAWGRWMFTGLAGAYVVFAVVLWFRVLRRPPT